MKKEIKQRLKNAINNLERDEALEIINEANRVPKEILKYAIIDWDDYLDADGFDMTCDGYCDKGFYRISDYSKIHTEIVLAIINKLGGK